MPTCMAIYFGLVYKCRGPVDQWKPAEAFLLRIVWDACNRYRLVADYFQRPQMNEAFSMASGDLRTTLRSQFKSIENLKPGATYLPVLSGYIRLCSHSSCHIMLLILPLNSLCLPLRKFLRKQTADMHNDMFPKWLGPFFIALYIIIDSGQVLDGNLTLGTWTEWKHQTGEDCEDWHQNFWWIKHCYNHGWNTPWYSPDASLLS